MTLVAERERVRMRLETEFPYYAEHLLKITNKDRELVPFRLNPAQVELERQLEAQRAAGKPMRAISLKARQIGISTYAQGKLIHRSTLTANHNALVVAHDAETGSKLYRMGERMYANLPSEDGFKPGIRSHRRGRFLHFGEKAADAWTAGEVYPDSTYLVDTAGEFEAGRGGTYHSVHASEFAFWPQPEVKLTGLNQGIPDDPDTLLVIESTANGMNLFADMWDDAEQGRSEFIPFFWPWWKQAEYELPFLNDTEREVFEDSIGRESYSEEEPELIRLMEAADIERDAIYRKLNWRRWAIPNKCLGKMDVFHQEYPSTPEEAFLTTGNKVFDGAAVRKVLVRAEITDPRAPSEEMPGPAVGAIKPTSYERRAGRVGPIEVPAEPEFIERKRLTDFEAADWRVWLNRDPDDDDSPLPRLRDGKLIVPERSYVLGADVSGGMPEGEDETAEPAYHAIQVIDQITKQQVCEYRSRVDPDIFADHVYMTALLFQRAWLAVEITGNYGMPIARKLALDIRYPFLYYRKKHVSRDEGPTERFGWDTNRSTKPTLIAGGIELLREETHGIMSRELASEMKTYVQLPTGKQVPERGKFADLLMAWLIAQQVALEQPLRRLKPGERTGRRRRRDNVTGY